MKSVNKIPTSKVQRASKIIKTGAKVVVIMLNIMPIESQNPKRKQIKF